MRAVGARKKSGFWGTWSFLEQVGGRGRYVVEGGGGVGGVFLRAGDLEVFLKNFWGSEPYGLSSGRVHANPIQIHHYEATDVLIALAGCTKVVQIYFYCASCFSAYFTMCFFTNPTLVDFRSTKPGIVQS